MTALATTDGISVFQPAPRLLGLRPVVAKEIHEWFANHRAPMLFVVTTLMMVLSTLSARFATASVPAAQLPPGLSLDPTVNVLVKWDQWVFFFAIVFSTSLLIVERDRGTLAWSLSKPLSRRALLVGKWVGAMAVYVPFGIVLPIAVCTVVATVAYGTPDVARIALAAVLLTAVPAFFIALTLSLATVLPSQSAVGGAAVLTAIVPGLVGTVAPGIAMALPPSIGSWATTVALGGPAPATTVVGWAIGFAAVAAAGLFAIGRRDL
jgi:ABC-type transport system involved in multi-copper enzyme maturation permease subunit